MFGLAVFSIGVSKLPTFELSQQRYYLLIISGIFVVMIGLRHEVGGDWTQYQAMYERAQLGELSEILFISSSDPGYSVLNWISVQADGGVYLVNMLVGLILLTGITMFAFRQPRPELVFVASVPYLIIVIGMGYSRQAAAIGFELIALCYLAENKSVKYVSLILVAALFHKSAVLMLPMAALISRRNLPWRLVWVGATGALAAYFILGDRGDVLWQNYVTTEKESGGTLIRVLMNGCAAVVFLIYRNVLTDDEHDRTLYTLMSLVSLASIPLSFLASTATDRVALYLIPLQLFVCGRADRISFRYAGIGTVGFYAAVQFVWLMFATHAFAWLPYQWPPWL